MYVGDMGHTSVENVLHAAGQRVEIVVLRKIKTGVLHRIKNLRKSIGKFEWRRSQSTPMKEPLIVSRESDDVQYSGLRRVQKSLFSGQLSSVRDYQRRSLSPSRHTTWNPSIVKSSFGESGRSNVGTDTWDPNIRSSTSMIENNEDLFF